MIEIGPCWMVTSEARLMFIENAGITQKFSCLFISNFFNDIWKYLH